jgi:tRNA1Val (adenine37-N6)-methyltransferase
VDALLLADFARVNPGERVVDLGAGAGVVALALSHRMKQGRVLGVEIQPRLAQCARLNFQACPTRVTLDLLEMDWDEITLGTPGLSPDGRPVDLVTCNPPYRRLGTGRINPDHEEAVARHEIKGSALSAIRCAERLLGCGGRLALVYPAVRLVELLTNLRSLNLEPKHLRMIHSLPGDTATLALVEAVKGAGEGLTVRPPLFLYQEENVYSREALAILAGVPAGDAAA